MWAGGCSVGPSYRPATVPWPEAWTELAPGGGTNGPPRLARWWKGFGDPTLDSLVARATEANYDLKATEARLRAARSLRGAVLADFLPTVDANASFTTARRSQNALAFPVRLIDTETYEVGFDANWEIDVFGGKRRSLEAANAGLQAVAEDRRAVLVSVLAEVARNYVELRSTQRRLAIARENVAAQQETVEITEERARVGLASDLEVAQARVLLAATRSQLPSLEALETESIHRLSLLVGQAPGALAADLAKAAPIPPAPLDVPAGLPSDLLQRRPDVRRSERQLAAANAQIGVATAELFPKFNLIGTAGFQSLDASTLISPASQFWTAGPSVRWRLLEYPRLRAQIRARTADQEVALAQFHQTILSSLEEVENALANFAKEKARLAIIDDQVQASRRAVDLANQVYTSGLGEFLNVLITQRALYEAEDAQAQSQRAIIVNLVALYKALGGGWEGEEPSK
jgi:NodT family efflux transporter outer membrane factor (OMF) lipoprotein